MTIVHIVLFEFKPSVDNEVIRDVSFAPKSILARGDTAGSLNTPYPSLSSEYSPGERDDNTYVHPFIHTVEEKLTQAPNKK